MAIGEVAVVETIRAVSGKKNDLSHALEKLVPIVRNTQGCLQYELLESLDQTDTFLVLMLWKKLEDLEKHERSALIEEFVQKYENVLYDEVKVSLWRCMI